MIPTQTQLKQTGGVQKSFNLSRFNLRVQQNTKYPGMRRVIFFIFFFLYHCKNDIGEIREEERNERELPKSEPFGTALLHFHTSHERKQTHERIHTNLSRIERESTKLGLKTKPQHKKKETKETASLSQNHQRHGWERWVCK